DRSLGPRSSMIACPTEDQLQQLLGRDDSPREDAGLVAHVGECATCRLRLEELADGGRMLLTAAGGLQHDGYASERPLRRVLDDLGGEAGATVVGPPVDRRSWVQKLLRPVPSLDSLGQLGGYEVTEILGQGSMRLVLTARDPALKRWVAIQVRAPDL